jgi:hypothetical protein
MPQIDKVRDDLEAAATAGLIDAAQVSSLAEFIAARRKPAQAAAAQPLPGEEDLRFIRNFHDVFLATGILLLSVGFAIALTTISIQTQIKGISAPLAAAAAAVLWALAETFARKRRLFLPSIAICASFAIFCVWAASSLYSALVGERMGFAFSAWTDQNAFGRGGAPVWAFSALAATAAFYRRFKLPFAAGLSGFIAVLALLSLVVLIAPGAFSAFYAPIMLLGGLGMFVAGIWFDMRDPARATRLSDNGFWLHLGAAPLILNGVMILVGGGLAALGAEHGPTAGSAVVTLLVVALLGFVSLLINRRALVVSALMTTGIAVGVLMNAVGLSSGALAASTLVLLGAGVLILGASWHKARAALLRRLPVKGRWALIIPPETAV